MGAQWPRGLAAVHAPESTPAEGDDQSGGVMGLLEGFLRSCLKRAFGTILVLSKYSGGANHLVAFELLILPGKRQGGHAFHPHNTDRKTKETSEAKDLPKWWKQDHEAADQAAPRSCADGSGWSSDSRSRPGTGGAGQEEVAGQDRGASCFPFCWRPQ